MPATRLSVQTDYCNNLVKRPIYDQSTLEWSIMIAISFKKNYLIYVNVENYFSWPYMPAASVTFHKYWCRRAAGFN